MSGQARQHDVMVRVAAQMRALRKARGWSAERLALEMTRAGLRWDRQVVTRLENGHRGTFSIVELQALADVFGITDPWRLTAERPACPRCCGTPPAGYICQAFGATS
ncbi:MAG: helix-turn-helix transcriptional regulator [Mycobacterium sp.]|nr:helix-turn-helix transcriptional regulator [Mycobacterium sp.]